MQRTPFSNFRIFGSLLYLILAAASIGAQETMDASAKTFKQFADYMANRDQVMQQYAFLAQMETKTTRGEDPQINHRWYYLRSGRSKPKFHYKAYARMPAEGDNMQGEQYWVEHSTDGREHVIGSGRNDYRKYSAREKKHHSAKGWILSNGIHMLHFDPFDDLMDLPTFTLFQILNEEACEKVFVKGARFIDASQTPSDTIRSNWVWKHGDIDCTITVDQSDEAGGMPTYILFSSVPNARYPFRSETRIRWEKLEDAWVPIVINAVMIDKFGPGSERHYNTRLWWRVGDQAQADFFDIESPDLRIPFMQSFNKKFDSLPILGDPWVRPEDMDIIIKPAK